MSTLFVRQYADTPLIRIATRTTPTRDDWIEAAECIIAHPKKAIETLDEILYERTVYNLMLTRGSAAEKAYHILLAAPQFSKLDPNTLQLAESALLFLSPHPHNATREEVRARTPLSCVKSDSLLSSLSHETESTVSL